MTRVDTRGQRAEYASVPRLFAIRRTAALAVVVLAVATLAGRASAAPGRTLTAAAIREWPPEYVVNSEGKPQGFAIDVINAVGRNAGFSVRYEIFDSFPAAMAALHAGRIDVVPNMGITDDRRALYDFTDPVETFNICLFVRAKSRSLRSLDDLKGREVAVVRSNVGVALLAGRSDIHTREYPDVRTAFYDLLAGRVDGLVYPEPVMRGLARRVGLEHRIAVVGPPLEEIKRGMAVRRGDAATLAVLNRGIARLSHSPEYAEIFNRWYAHAPPFWNVRRVLWISGAVVAVLLVAFGFWRARATFALGMKEAERLRAEALQAHTEVKYRSIMDNASDGVFISDIQGRFLDVNQRAWEMLGYSNEELLQLRIADVVSPADQARRGLDLSGLVGAGPTIVERVLVRKDGSELPAEVSAGVVDDNTVVGIVRDITERKRSEAALREHEVMLRHSQKMEAVGRLAGGVAHDFNNLLTAITGYAELLLHELPEGSVAVADVQQIREATERGAALSRQLLTFSRRDVRAPEVLDVDRVVSSFENMLRRVIGEDIEFSVESDASGHVEADRGQLEQVLMNLVVNARDALPDGGRITVRTYDAKLQAPLRTRTGEVAPGAYVVVEIEDTGIGMSEELQAQIFEPFFTTKPAHKGTGLGLSTVLGIVQQGGGIIDVRSTPGGGTTFRIHLPASDRPSSPATPNPGVAASSPARRHQTVLVVEDEPAVRNVLARALRSHGFEVVHVASGEAALARIAEGLSFELLVTDVVMPGITGVVLAERVRRGHPDLPVVYVSGYANPHLASEQLERPNTTFLQKPFQPQSLLDAVERLLERA